ncbi:TPA: protein translocase subunit SecF [Candidatus Poribacteria bacterium]|nr:protein translocase subunit SecF [Candidatus Poribacteria bacterium]
MELLRDINVDFISKRHIAYVISGVIILAGIISLVVKGGPDLGIDFKGGVQIHVKFGIPLSGDPGDESATAVTISTTALNSQSFNVGNTIHIAEGEWSASAHIKSITPHNGTATIELTKPLGRDFTQAAMIQPIVPIPVEEIQSRLVKIGYQPTITPSGIDEMLISVGATETTPVPLSADPGDGTASSVTITVQQLQTQLFQEGDTIIIEDTIEGRKISERREIKSISTDDDKVVIELTQPLQKDFTATATIRYRNVGRHIANNLQRAESAQGTGSIWKVIPEGVNISEVGPNIGRELRWIAIFIVLGSMVGLLLYISWRFELRFAVGAIAALFHDVFFTLGLFSILSKEINLPTLAAFLTIVGYSLNDTIVVFDRIRENVNLLKGWSYDDIINRSINQSLSRTIITSLTTLMVVLTIFSLAGAGELNTFALALIIGVIIGTYSSIFIASPILHGWHLRIQKKET